MARLPDDDAPEPETPRFDALPILTVYTVRNDAGTHLIDACSDRFRERLDHRRSALVGRPLEGLYDAAGVPEPPSDDGKRRDPLSDGGDSMPAGGSLLGFDMAVDAPDGESTRWQPAAAERDLIAADGSLIHTIAESVPREDGDGYAVFHIDVTRQKRREKQVGVLNRLLRHNVRNDLNLLRGYARTLRDREEAAIVEAGEVIDRIADRWLGLAETGREIEQLSATLSPGTVSLGDLLSAARASVERDHPAGRVEIRFDGVDPEALVSKQWYAALVELCENGIKHATTEQGEESGRVSVTVERAERSGWIAIAVADRGPGIPPEERTTLDGGPETPLRHGSGLGLWLVRFVVEQFGGRVAVDDREAGGSVVRLTVPIAYGE